MNHFLLGFLLKMLIGTQYDENRDWLNIRLMNSYELQARTFIEIFFYKTKVMVSAKSKWCA